MAAGNLDDPLSAIPNVVTVDQGSATAAPGAGFARWEVVNGVGGIRAGSGAWVPFASLVAGLLTSLTEKATPAGTDLVLLQDEADSSALKKAQVANLPGAGEGGLYDAYAQYSYTLAYNVTPGDFAANAWTKYPLNTEDFDTGAVGSMASSVITLPAGVYYAEAIIQAYATNERVRLRLRDTTGGVTLARGECIPAYAGNLVQIPVHCSGRFTLAVESAVQLEYFSLNTGSDGIGMGNYNIGAGEDITHGRVTIWREAG